MFTDGSVLLGVGGVEGWGWGVCVAFADWVEAKGLDARAAEGAKESVL